MPVYRIELDVENEAELEVAVADGRWKPELVQIDEIASEHIATVTVVDPYSGGDVEVEIRLMETGGMVGFDGSWLEQNDQHPFSPYDQDAVVVVPDDEEPGPQYASPANRPRVNQPSKTLLDRIAGRLSGMHEDDLTTAERQISELLLGASLLHKDDQGNLLDNDAITPETGA